MNKLRTALSLLLCTLLILPAAISAAPAEASRGVGSEPAVLDTDGADGYSGDYVVIYNPSVIASEGLSTGSLEGLISTSVYSPAKSAGECELDITLSLLEKEGRDAARMETAFETRTDETVYEPGDTRIFTLNNYSPLGKQVEFKVLAKGDYCYVWTPTSNAENVYPLDEIDESYGQIACEKFDSCYPLLEQYLDKVNAAATGGRISLLYYNIEDGWTSGNPYIGGFFSAGDCVSNGIPVLSLDTYPGVYHPTEDGGWDSRFERSFGIAVHEYQHMVNVLRASNMELWLNEAMSSATEEFCYPGSCLVQRIPGWVNTNIVGGGQQNAPSYEYEYAPDFAVHNGASLYSWNDNENDVGALYGRITLFSQYLYTHFGNEVFRTILMNYKDYGSAKSTLRFATGVNMTELVRRFNIACCANDPAGTYSFAMQPGYEPSQYYGIESLYSWLAPVVYTGEGLTIYAGAAVTVKPVDGVFFPPEDADAGLVYIGVTVSDMPEPTDTPEPTETTEPTPTPTTEPTPTPTTEPTPTPTTEPTPTPTTEPTPTPDTGLKGDVDGNGVVNANDALLTLRFALNIIGLDEGARLRADVDGSGVVNANDALLILRYSLHIIPEL